MVPNGGLLMARGNEAKQEVIQRIAEAFGADWIGEVDKKYYVFANENGEKLQIAISLTCPKTQVEVKNESYSNKLNFESGETYAAPAQPIEISEEEKKNLADLMARLGL